MNEKTKNTICFTTALILAITAIVFLLISMFVITDKNWPLDIALGCSGVAGLLNAFRWNSIKKEKN